MPLKTCKITFACDGCGDYFSLEVDDFAALEHDFFNTLENELFRQMEGLFDSRGTLCGPCYDPLLEEMEAEGLTKIRWPEHDKGRVR